MHKHNETHSENTFYQHGGLYFEDQPQGNQRGISPQPERLWKQIKRGFYPEITGHST